ncbi:MAG: hypothetical protein VX768_06885 [Planctomycetota bacterium]|jgi:hypothetical protein|nr:hypothetical protein [Planctomycetota bacterium]
MKHDSAAEWSQHLAQYRLGGQLYSRIKFQSLFPVIEKSLEENRLWVSDFKDDEVFLPSDLCDIVDAYAHFYGQLRNSA